MKTLVKNLLPNGLVWYLREYRNIKTYQSWNDAKIAAGLSYDNALVTRFRSERAKLNHGNHKTISGVLATCAMLVGKTVRVTDFGGAVGEFAGAILSLCPEAKYIVVESEAVVRSMEKFGQGLEFSTEIPDQCDIFFTSCVIPYLDKPFEVLERGFKSAARICIVARNSFSTRDLFRVQRSKLFDNGSGAIPPGFKNIEIKYPHRTTNEGDVIILAQKCGFRFVAKFPDDSGVLPFKGRVTGGTLVFARTAFNAVC